MNRPGLFSGGSRRATRGEVDDLDAVLRGDEDVAGLTSRWAMPCSCASISPS